MNATDAIEIEGSQKGCWQRGVPGDLCSHDGFGLESRVHDFSQFYTLRQNKLIDIHLFAWLCWNNERESTLSN